MNPIRLAAAFAVSLAFTQPALAWEPTKPVEIVVAAGAGGAIKKHQAQAPTDSGSEEICAR